MIWRRCIWAFYSAQIQSMVNLMVYRSQQLSRILRLKRQTMWWWGSIYGQKLDPSRQQDLIQQRTSQLIVGSIQAKIMTGTSLVKSHQLIATQTTFVLLRRTLTVHLIRKTLKTTNLNMAHTLATMSSATIRSKVVESLSRLIQSRHTSWWALKKTLQVVARFFWLLYRSTYPCLSEHLTYLTHRNSLHD